MADVSRTGGGGRGGVERSPLTVETAAAGEGRSEGIARADAGPRSPSGLPRTAIGILPARFESSRFPGKPLVELLGKTVIQRTWEQAKRARLLEEVWVATDDARIFDHVRSFGGNVVMTSSLCMTGSDRCAEAVARIPGAERHTVIVNIQGDEPIIDPKAIDAVAASILCDSTGDIVMSSTCSVIRSREEAESRDVVKVVLNHRGRAMYYSRALIPHSKSGAYNPETRYLRAHGLYGFRRDFLALFAALPMGDTQKSEDLEQLKVLEAGFQIQLEIVDDVARGVDRPDDVPVVEALLREKGLDR